MTKLSRFGEYYGSLNTFKIDFLRRNALEYIDTKVKISKPYLFSPQ